MMTASLDWHSRFVSSGQGPQPVKASRHQVVHLVIAFGDLGEDLVDEALLFVLADAAEAEGHILFWRVLGHGESLAGFA